MYNFISKKSELDDCEQLTEEHKLGILSAIEELESGKGIPHEKVMENMRKKF